MHLRAEKRLRRLPAGLFPTLAAAGLVVAAAAFAPWGETAAASPVAPRIRGLDAAALFPESTLSMFALDGRPCVKYAKDLGLARIYHHPQMQEFLAPAIQLIGMQLEQGLDDDGAPFDVRAALDLLATGRTMLGLTKFEFVTIDRGDVKTEELHVDFMLGLQFSQGRQEKLREIVKAIESYVADNSPGPAPKDVKVGGVDGKSISFQQGEEYTPFSEITYVIENDWLLMATDAAQLEQSILRLKSGDAKGSLAADPVYARCAKETVREKTVFGAYVNIKDILARVRKSEFGDIVMAQLAGSGVESMGAIALGTDLDGLAIRDRMYLHGYSSAGVVEKPNLAPVLALLPRNSAAVSASALDFVRALDLVMAGVASQAGDMGEKLLREFEQEHQVDVRKDLLEPFGPEYGVYAALPKHGILPDFGVVLRAADAAKAEAAIKKLFGLAKIDQYGSLKYREATIVSADTTALDLRVDGKHTAPRPSYCFLPGGFVLLSPWPQAAKNFLDGLARQDGGFGLRDDAAAIFARIKGDVPNAGMGGVAYFDVPAFAGFVLDALAPALQTAVPSGEVPLEMALFPQTEVFTSNLVPIVMTTQYDKEGMSVVSVSPTGVAPIYAISVAAVAGFMVRSGGMAPPGETRVIEVVPAEEDPEKGGEGGGKDK
jgi:hypothetical protein